MIGSYAMQLAKNALASGSSVSQAAYNLGFEYPRHFCRMFKNKKTSPHRSIAAACTVDAAN